MAVGSYGYVSWVQAQSMLASRLYDPQMVKWTPTELGLYLQEALRTWNALTAYWRADFPFSTVAGQQWYDITQLPGTLRPFTVTDNQLLQMIEYHLQEPTTGNYPLVWDGSNQFGVEDILNALTRRQDETLGLSGCTLTRELINAPIGGRVLLDDSTVDVVRVAWFPVPAQGYPNKPLRQTDVWAKRSFNPGWTTAPEKPPTSWIQSSQPPLSFDVDSVPPVNGQYELLAVNSGGAFGTTVPTTLSVPDDWSWVVKWGALLDLLGEESNAKDSLRAQYVEKRYKDGLALLALAPAMLEVRWNNLPLGVSDVRGADNFNSQWQNYAGSPRSAYTAGLNLVALYPTPDTPIPGSYGMTLSVVQNAPTLTANIQINREDLDTVIDYAQHLAMFKIGGGEFEATIPLFQKFMSRAALVSAKLASMGEFQVLIYAQAQWEATRDPRFDPEGVVSAK